MIRLNLLKIALPLLRTSKRIKLAEITITGCKSSNLGEFEEKYFPKSIRISISKCFLSR